MTPARDAPESRSLTARQVAACGDGGRKHSAYTAAIATRRASLQCFQRSPRRHGAGRRLLCQSAPRQHEQSSSRSGASVRQLIHRLSTSRCAGLARALVASSSLRRLWRKAPRPRARIRLGPRWRPPHRHCPSTWRERRLPRHESGPRHRAHRAVCHRKRAAVSHPWVRHTRMSCTLHSWLLHGRGLPLLLRAATACAPWLRCIWLWRIWKNASVRRRLHSAPRPHLPLLP